MQDEVSKYLQARYRMAKNDLGVTHRVAKMVDDAMLLFKRHQKKKLSTWWKDSKTVQNISKI